MNELNPRERLRYTIDISIISIYFIFLIYLFTKQIYSEFSELYYSLTKTPGLLDTEQISKMVNYTKIIGWIMLYILLLIGLITDKRKMARSVSLLAIIAGITIIINIVLLYNMKPKQRRVPLLKLAQVNKLKKRIQTEAINIFLVCAGGAFTIGLFLAYVQGTNYFQIARNPRQFLYKGRQRMQQGKPL